MYTGLSALIVAAGVFSFTLLRTADTATTLQGPDQKLSKEARIKEIKEYFNAMVIPIGAEKSPAPANFREIELRKALKRSRSFRKAEGEITFVHRGPNNVAGRTRGLIVDPDDPTWQTWYAGTATGGLWKTTDGGDTWECLSDSIVYQTTTVLAMAPSNTQVIYMGTGESYTGEQNTGGGIYRSTNKGESWDHLEATANEDFRFVNRIAIDPDNDSIVVAATNNGIFKTTDAGATWTQTYVSGNPVEDLRADTADFNYMYATENEVGVWRSVDGGENWEAVNEGLPLLKRRMEIAVARLDPTRLYLSVEIDPDNSALYMSADRGDSWKKVVDESLPNENFLRQQGWYDNTIAVHPYDNDIVYWGGVVLYRAEIGDSDQTGEGYLAAFDTINTGSFLDFIPFTGNVYPGMNTGDLEEATNLVPEDFVSVEIRFGPGMTQKAHRFQVPFEATSGVPAADYTYMDYVDVPFEVWDVTNNRQLMASFRDQERDGAFNLYERSDEETNGEYGLLGREYLFVNAVEYSETPDPNIAVNAGRTHKNIYFFWPTLAEGATWDPENLPDSRMSIVYTVGIERPSAIEAISASNGSGPNAYNQGAGLNQTAIPGLHPDHHNLMMLPRDEGSGEFWILNANDGGISISYDGEIFEQKVNNIPTTQFYGVAKKPYRNEYIGGTQDNGTWQSQPNEEATPDSDYRFRLTGDGFETLWNYQDSSAIMGSIYFNAIRTSFNGGQSWSDADEGISDGPFVSRLEAVPSNNNIVFAVGSEGVYKTGNFARTRWRLTPIGEGWFNADVFTYPVAHRVKVSPANEQIVWAGGGFNTLAGQHMFVSTDQGNTFDQVNDPADPVPSYYISGLATHPTEENTAYVMHALYGDTKIFRTTDLGDTWEDITQFTDGESQNGFPDVPVWTLIVFPDSTDLIWAGTDIGIVESNDNGATWHMLESNLPTVPIYQLSIRDNQVIVATYGRGIWTWQFADPPEKPVVDAVNPVPVSATMLDVYPNPSYGQITVILPEVPAEGLVSYTVYSLSGQALLQDEASTGSGEVVLDLNRLEAGSYLLRIDDEGNRYTARIRIAR